MNKRPHILRELKTRQWSNRSMKGWKERGDELPPPYVRDAVRQTVERLRKRILSRGDL